MKLVKYNSIAKKVLIAALSVFTTITASVKVQNSDSMKKKILFVVTNHVKKGNTGEKTGFYLSEVTHPWDILVNAGYEVDFVSPKGGKAPVEGFNLSDPTNKKFWLNTEYREKIENTMKPQNINPEDYTAIHFAGGHGAMWDLPNNKQLTAIASRIYENNGIISAVSHGPAGLLNIKLSDDKYLVDGKKINAFTNEEETAVKLDKAAPFLLESKLIERGAIFEKSGLWQIHVTVDDRLVTGQNPQSAREVGEALLEQLTASETISKLTLYDVKEKDLEQFRKALKNYVTASLSSKDNVMAEAFYEQEKNNILWLIERWEGKSQLDNFSGKTQSKALQSLTEKLKISPKIYYVKDLEPLTKEQWRKTSKKEDNQLVIMLFVDGKKGTEKNFKDTYHIAMPQFRSEPGVVTYQLSQIEGDETQFVTYEKFRSNDAFQYHLNFPPIKPVIEYLETSIKKPPFQNGLHNLIEFAPLTRE